MRYILTSSRHDASCGLLLVLTGGRRRHRRTRNTVASTRGIVGVRISTASEGGTTVVDRSGERVYNPIAVGKAADGTGVLESIASRRSVPGEHHRAPTGHRLRRVEIEIQRRLGIRRRVGERSTFAGVGEEARQAKPELSDQARECWAEVRVGRYPSMKPESSLGARNGGPTPGWDGRR